MNAFATFTGLVPTTLDQHIQRIKSNTNYADKIPTGYMRGETDTENQEAFDDNNALLLKHTFETSSSTRVFDDIDQNDANSYSPLSYATHRVSDVKGRLFKTQCHRTTLASARNGRLLISIRTIPTLRRLLRHLIFRITKKDGSGDKPKDNRNSKGRKSLADQNAAKSTTSKKAGRVAKTARPAYNKRYTRTGKRNRKCEHINCFNMIGHPRNCRTCPKKVCDQCIRDYRRCDIYQNPPVVADDDSDDKPAKPVKPSDGGSKIEKKDEVKEEPKVKDEIGKEAKDGKKEGEGAGDDSEAGPSSK